MTHYACIMGHATFCVGHWVMGHPLLLWRAAQNCGYLSYSEANFEVFRPTEATRCTDGGDAKFRPHRCNDKGIETSKLTFLLRFDQNVEYKCPEGRHPLHDVHKICRVCTPFQVQ